MFSINLKKLRQSAGLTQTEFAKELGVAIGTVGNWESGNRKPDIDTIKKIAEFFHSTIDYLLGEEVNKDEEIKVALFGGDTEVTDEMWQEVKQFAEYVKNKNSNK